jgi:hypothetical protein
MSFECPSCKAAIPDAVRKADFDAMKATADTAKSEAAKAIGDSAKYHAEAQALAKYKTDTEPAVAKLHGELGTALQNVALSRRGFNDEAKAKSFRALYSIYAAEAGANAKGFDAWLDNEAKADPILAPHFAGPPAKNPDPPPPAPAAPAQAKPNPLPGSNAGAVPEPPRQGAMSPKQLQDYFRSPEFMGLNSEQKRAKRNELESQIRQQRTTAA